MKYYLCLDVGGTEIKFNVVNEDGELQNKTKTIQTPMPKNRDRFGRVLIEDFPKARVAFVLTIEELLKDIALPIAGIALSHPGEIESTTGNIRAGGALNFMGGTNLNELLEHLEIPVCIENDARCVAIAEYVSGAAKGNKNFACITIGTGLGAGFFVNGEVLTGANFSGGEYGVSLHRQDADGKYLTFHETCSMTALRRRYAQIKNIDISKNEVTGKDIFAHAEDEQVAEIIAEWYLALAVCIRNIACTFDSEKILVGGGVSARPEVIAGIEHALQMMVTHTRMKIPWRDTPVVACKYRNNAGLIGAFYKFKEQHQL